MIVLDTHIWLWWVNKNTELLSSTQKDALEKSDQLAICAISCFEVAWLDRHQRIVLPQNKSDWFEKALDGSGILLLPITPKIAEISVELPEHHRDPQDRLIIATAIAQGIKIVLKKSLPTNIDQRPYGNGQSALKIQAILSSKKL